jgi:hypothetical protein
MTGPTHVVSRWERIKRLTVWHPINTDPLDDDRWTVRVWLPLYDGLAILAGLIAFYIGSPLMNRLFPSWVVDWTAIVFAVAGVITFFGVVIPRLWRVEIGGKVLMSFLMTTYAMLVLTFPSRDGQTNAFVTVILIMATWGIYPRLTKLFIRGYQASKSRKALMA